MGHRVPSESADVMGVAREILRLYLENTGVRGVLSKD